MPSRKQYIDNIVQDMQIIRRSLFPKSALARNALVEIFGKGRPAAGSDSGLTPARLRVLMTVVRFQREEAQGPTVKQLAAGLLMTPSAVTQAVDTLVDAGYLKRESDSGDRRATLVQMTPRTEQQVDALKAYLSGRLQPVFKALSTAELAEYDRLSKKLAHAAQSLYREQHDPGN